MRSLPGSFARVGKLVGRDDIVSTRSREQPHSCKASLTQRTRLIDLNLHTPTLSLSFSLFVFHIQTYIYTYTHTHTCAHHRMCAIHTTAPAGSDFAQPCVQGTAGGQAGGPPGEMHAGMHMMEYPGQMQVRDLMRRSPSLCSVNLVKLEALV